VGLHTPRLLVFVIVMVMILASCPLSPTQDALASMRAEVLTSTAIFPALQTHMPTKQGNVPHLQPTEPTGPFTPPKVKLDPIQLKREGLELQELSESLQLDIESVNQGKLPKDMGEKLKRIQKLAKHLRGEITQ
jgi:hypothetical protein